MKKLSLYSKVSQLLFMDNLKLYCIDESFVSSLIDTVCNFSADIRMEPRRKNETCRIKLEEK